MLFNRPGIVLFDWGKLHSNSPFISKETLSHVLSEGFGKTTGRLALKLY